MKLRKLVARFVATSLISTTMVFSGISTDVSAETIPDSYEFSLQGQIGTTTRWNSDAQSINIAADGSYTLTFALNEATTSTSNSSSNVLSLVTNINPFDYVESGKPSETGITITVNSVTVDGGTKTLTYNYSSDSYKTDDSGDAIRLNLYNTWGGNSCTDLNMDFTAEKSIEVNFTVSGLESSMQKAKEAQGQTTTTTTTTASTSVVSSNDGSSDSTTYATIQGEDIDSGDTGIVSATIVFVLAGATAIGMRKKH